jgi:threonine 3-dehydrogenase
MFEVILRSNDALNALVTHEFALDNVEEAFQVQLSGACGKVLLYPFGAEVSI